jgi:hypothetical protein
MRSVFHLMTLVSLLLMTAPVLSGTAAGQVLEPGSWATAAPLPDERTEVSVASDGERLYLLGGFAAGRQAPRAVYAYEPQTNEWSQIADLPEGVNHAGLVHMDGSLYLVGGYREATFDAVDHLRIFDIEAGTWRDGPALPTARGALAVAAYGGRIHAIGGVDSARQRTGAHEIFDPAAETWTTAAAMPTPRDHLAAATVEGEIVALAGRDGTSFTLTANEIYDVASDTWRSGAAVPTGRSGVAAVELDRFVYLFGGETMDPDSTFAEAERYDPKTDTWAALPPMPTARHGLGAGVLDGRIYVVAGGLEAGLAFSAVNEVLTPE